MSTAKTTAKSTLYAAVGAGATALEKAKELPQRVITLPQKLQNSIDLRDLPKQARELPKQIRQIDLRELPKSINAKAINVKPQAIVDQAKTFSANATEYATKAYAEFTKLGEKTVKQLRKNGGKKAAAKKTTAKAKAAAPKKAAESNGTSEAATAPVSTN